MLRKLNRSIVYRVGLLMFAISMLAVLSMTSSVFISDSAEQDAYAVNVSGSIRMQSYRLLNTIQHSSYQTAQEELAELEKRLQSNTLTSGTKNHSSELSQAYKKVQQHWQDELKPLFQKAINEPIENSVVRTAVDRFVVKLETLVSEYQRHAEQNIAKIRLIQGLALLAMALLMIIAMYILNHYIKHPLAQLTQVARQIGRGDFTGRANDSGKDELSLLGYTLNHMSEAISRSHSTMEQRVKNKTADLERSNAALEMLYDITRELHSASDNPPDFKQLLSKLVAVTAVKDVDLCLMTVAGNKPYEHIPSRDKVMPLRCIQQSCDDCLNQTPQTPNSISFPLVHAGDNYGVLVCEMFPGQTIQSWQEQLFRSVSEQIAVSLSLRSQHEQQRRLVLMHERNVIARELHDSLAQGLSYLKIQVARLQKLLSQPDGIDKIEPVIDELKLGLNSAYRELRELLTTFRLKMDGQDLQSAMQQSLEQLQSRTDNMQLILHFNAGNIPFSPNEEIHLLQITREACQNAIHHSQGSRVKIAITTKGEDDKQVQLAIRDNGVGISNPQGKLNHYGLAIMMERARNLGGELNISQPADGGTEISFIFIPACFKQKPELVVNH
ncbi:histidine kinase [Lacimicrobium sp. SS2-24]|uniref:histidine kinase n=1 Tax=Lacimicrobium sp. SS2-24 TaxID=2005569 RepID=UPI000B4AA097|nr:histidine kinase [Lacimicrobium sp. SS2-24]